MKEVLRKGKRTKNEVHLVRPITIKEFKQNFAKKKVIYMSKSTYERLAETIKTLISKKKIRIVFEKIPGRPIEKDPSKLHRAVSLYKSGIPLRDIEKKTEIPRSTVHYLVKKAKRNKIKNKSVIYSLD